MNLLPLNNDTIYYILIPWGIVVFCTILYYLLKTDTLYSLIVSKDKKYVKETLVHIQQLLENPTKSNVIEATHLYVVAPYRITDTLDIADLERNLLVHFLNMLSEEKDNKLLSTPLTIDNIETYFSEYDNYLRLVEYVDFELDELYEEHKHDEELTNQIRNLDASFDMFMRIKAKPKEGTPIDVDLSRSGSIILKNLLKLHGMRNKLDLKYITIGVLVYSEWKRKNYNSPNLQET